MPIFLIWSGLYEEQAMPTKTEKVSGIAKFRQHQQLRKARTNLRDKAVVFF